MVFANNSILKVVYGGGNEISFLLTKKLNQDILENTYLQYLAKKRRYNRNPTVKILKTFSSVSIN